LSILLPSLALAFTAAPTVVTKTTPCSKTQLSYGGYYRGGYDDYEYGRGGGLMLPSSKSPRDRVSCCCCRKEMHVFVCCVRTAPFLIHCTLLTFLCDDSGTMIATCTAETIGALTNVLMIMGTLACAGKSSALFSFVIMSIVMIIETLIYCWLTPPVFVSLHVIHSHHHRGDWIRQGRNRNSMMRDNGECFLSVKLPLSDCETECDTECQTRPPLCSLLLLLLLPPLITTGDYYMDYDYPSYGGGYYGRGTFMREKGGAGWKYTTETHTRFSFYF
jgi:hypothetical protein